MAVTRHEVAEAIEELGSVVSYAGGRGDSALDVVKDAVAEVERLRAENRQQVADLRERDAEVERRRGRMKITADWIDNVLAVHGAVRPDVAREIASLIRRDPDAR